MKFIRKHITAKSIIGMVLLLVLFSVVVSIIGFNGFTSALMQQYADGAFRTARTASSELSADLIDYYWTSEGKTAEYLAIYDRLERLCNSSGSTFIYVIQPDTSDYAHIRFLFSTINADSRYTKYDFGYLRETTNDDYKQKYKALYEGTSEQELVVRDQGYIETDPHITAMIPLKDRVGKTQGILCVQRQMDVLIAARNNYLKKILWVLAVLVVLFIAGEGLYFSGVLLAPIQKISNEASRFASEGIPSQRKLREIISNTDEIGDLAASIDRMEEDINSYVENIRKITAEKERISTELSLATRLQAAYIPHDFPPFPDRKEFDLYATMEPAREVGGDFYDFFLIDDDHLCLIMADVSGKGIPAALFMMVSKMILSSCAMLGKSAAEILTKTNEALCANNQEDMFVTVWLGILEISTGKLTAANAGHEYPALMQNGGSFGLYKDLHGFVVGGFEGMDYSEYELQLSPGDKLFLYTDGVPEASDAGRNMFGIDRMIKALNEDPQASPLKILTNVRGAVDIFVNGAEQFDDLTMLCFEYLGGQ